MQNSRDLRLFTLGRKMMSKSRNKQKLKLQMEKRLKK